MPARIICEQCIDGSCLPCRKREISRRWYANNTDKIMADRERRKEQTKVYRKKYYAEHREQAIAYSASWEQANPEKVSEYHRKRYRKDPAKINARNKRYNENNKEKVAERQARYARENVEDRRKSHRKQQGILEFDKGPELATAQGNVCAICSSPAPTHMDHDHATGRARGMLCRLCNNGIGMLRDNPDLLEKAIVYLKDPPAQMFLDFSHCTEGGRD